MAKKSLKDELNDTAVRVTEGSVGSALGTAEGASSPVEMSDKFLSDDDRRLFQLYVARISTIDLYRVPISDKGLPMAFTKALDQAKVALEIFNSRNERN